MDSFLDASIGGEMSTGQASKLDESQFAPLSDMCVAPGMTMPHESPVDSMTLTKTTQKDPEEKKEKNINSIIKDSEVIMRFCTVQSKHQKAIQNELKSLLEHEKTILQQLIDRSMKFTEMKEENKKKHDSWEAEHNERMPMYHQYLKQLLEIPEQQGITQEGMPGEIQQRILYDIVDNTSNVASNAIVQLSIQNTLVNDVDLSLSKLRQYCVVMMKHIDNWLNMISTQLPNCKRVRDQWDTLESQLKKMKSVPEKDLVSAAEGVTPVGLQNLMSSVDNRISKLENIVTQISSQMSSMMASMCSSQQSQCTPSPIRAGPNSPHSLSHRMSPLSLPRSPLNARQLCVTPQRPTQRHVSLAQTQSRRMIPAPELGSSSRCKPATSPSHKYSHFTPGASSSPKVNCPRRTYSQVKAGIKELAGREYVLERRIGQCRRLRNTLAHEVKNVTQLNEQLQRNLHLLAEEAD